MKGYFEPQASKPTFITQAVKPINIIAAAKSNKKGHGIIS